jgi:hypothetical protein
MFTQQCFIRKNSEKLRSELDKLGYASFRKINDLQCLMTFGKIGDFECFYDSLSEKFINSLNNTIDCGTNEKLFLAIAALRDDSDKFQYFTNCVFWIKCSQLELKHELDNNYEEFCVADFHKATVEELIEHFNK